MLFIIAFLTGLTVGSFLNVVIIRGELNESLGGRSKCRSCNKTLSARELVPIISFLIQKGRCLHCGTALLWQYPLVELGTGVSYGLATLFVPSLTMLVPVLIGIGALEVILVSDLRFQIIPDGAVLILLILGIIRLWYGGYGSMLKYDLSAAVILSAIPALLWLLSKGRWMGLGDAKLILATSLILGFPASLIAFLFSFWLGGIIGTILLITGFKSLQSKIPFGPFIIMGSLLAYLFTNNFLLFMGIRDFFEQFI